MKKIDNLVDKAWSFDFNKTYYLLYEEYQKAILIKRLKLVSYQIDMDRGLVEGRYYLDGTFRFINEDNWECYLHDTNHPHKCMKYEGVLYEPETDDPEEELRTLLMMRELIT